MAEFPAIPLWTDAYLADTRHLSTLEHGAYLLLLMEAWRRPTCCLPANDVLLARLAGVSIDVWDEIKDVIMAFWKLDGRSKTWSQKRLTLEQSYVRVRSQLQRDRIAKRWNKEKKEDTTVIPDGYRIDTPTPTPTPTIEEKEIAAAISKKTMPVAIPSDWQPGPLTPSVADLVMLWPEGRLDREVEQFRDYWSSSSGPKMRKTDWQKTWHNRIRDQHDRIMRENRNEQHITQPTLRGLRPDPSLDLLYAAERQLAAERGDGEDHRRIGPPLSADKQH